MLSVMKCWIPTRAVLGDGFGHGRELALARTRATFFALVGGPGPADSGS